MLHVHKDQLIMPIDNPEDWAVNLVNWKTGMAPIPKINKPIYFGENSWNAYLKEEAKLKYVNESIKDNPIAKKIDEDIEKLKVVIENWAENKNNLLARDEYNFDFLEI
jgi:hypothetical protein